MKRLIIFGTGDVAQLAHFYFGGTGEWEIAAFVVDDEYRTSDSFCGCPLVPMSELSDRYPPAACHAFAAVGYKRMNALREEKYHLLKRLGYRMASYISRDCTCLTSDIGEHAFILEDNTIQPFVRIGRNVTLWSGNHIGHHSVVGDHVFISSHVVVSGGVRIGSHAFLGVNATLRDRITIGEAALIGAGALVTRDVPDRGVVKGSSSALAAVTSDQLKRI